MRFELRQIKRNNTIGFRYFYRVKYIGMNDGLNVHYSVVTYNKLTVCGVFGSSTIH